jgi:hypothetical protein
MNIQMMDKLRRFILIAVVTCIILILLPGNKNKISAVGTQTLGDPHNWDIAGIRLDINVDQAKAAILAHDPSMKVQVLESPSQIGKSTFTGGVAGLTGSQFGKSDAILIYFTETEGNKAYSISRVVT